MKIIYLFKKNARQFAGHLLFMIVSKITSYRHPIDPVAL